MKTKDEVRKEIREIMEKNPVAFPKPLPAHGVPNFAGLYEAAEKLEELPEWRDAKAIKVSLSLSLELVRKLALEGDKIVYAAMLKEEKAYVELNPGFSKGQEQYGSPIWSALKEAYIFGRGVDPGEMRKIDLCITSSVAVNVKGSKMGKGGGSADLTYAIGRDFGIISDKTTVVELTHPLQVVDYDIPMERNDVPVDYILTPEKIIKTGGHYPKPEGVYWEHLREDYKGLPILRKLKKHLNLP
jgi:5-formyltetrahydrofolate cyclo-ligase